MVKDREILSTEEQLGLSKEQIQQLKDKSLSKAGRIEVAVLLLNETYTFTKMVTVETYIKHRNCFIKIEPDTDIEFITDVCYLEGAIVIKYYTQEIMGLKQYDLINHLWSYFIDAIDELIEGKRETSFWFPDQPLNVILRNEKNNRNGLLIIIGKKTYMVEKKEFFLEILSAADVFWELLAQCDVSVLERKNKIQEIRKKL